MVLFPHLRAPNTLPFVRCAVRHPTLYSCASPTQCIKLVDLHPPLPVPLPPPSISRPQVVAYNKTDLPDSGDYWEFVREYLVEEEGLDPDRVIPISAATGRGVKGALLGSGLTARG